MGASVMRWRRGTEGCEQSTDGISHQVTEWRGMAVSKNSRQINGLNSKLQGIDFNQKLAERTGLEPAEAVAESATY